MLVIINGSPMEQGLRWGDLLSTFLFVLGANVLNRLMNNVVLEGLVKVFLLEDNVLIFLTFNSLMT